MNNISTPKYLNNLTISMQILLENLQQKALVKSAQEEVMTQDSRAVLSGLVARTGIQAGTETTGEYGVSWHDADKVDLD